jgi:rhomboid protease GluP
MLNFRQTPVTILLLIAIGAVFLLEWRSGGSTDGETLIRLGANYGPAVFEHGEWWRLLTSTFLHIGIFHLAVNSWALVQIGGLFERWIGSASLIAGWLLCGVAGSYASLLWRSGPENLSAGASGAIFGLLGALITFLLRRRHALLPSARSILSSLVMWAGINVFLGFSVPGIDNAAHLGGLAAGLLLGLVLRERKRRPVAPYPEIPV